MEPDLELVRKAITSQVRGDCVWKEAAERRVRSDRDLEGLTPAAIQKLLQDHVAQHPESITRRTRNEPEYTEEFWYRVIIPVKRFKHGLFVKIILIDEDPDAPQVQIVSVHEQHR